METGVKTNIRPSVSRVGRRNISRGLEDPEGDKRKSMQPEHPECIGDKERQVGDKWETSARACSQSTQSVLETGRDKGEASLSTGDKWETSV